MTCHSGGTLEIYVEPFLPKALLLLVGHGPVIETLATLAKRAGYAVATLPGRRRWRPGLRGLALGPDSSVVVATHGELDEDALTQVLATPAGYISLVASRKRAASILEHAAPARRAARAPRAAQGARRARHRRGDARGDRGQHPGRDHPACVTAARRTTSRRPPSSQPAAAEARDPICGMTVEIATARYQSDWAGRSVYFCCLRCKELFDADPERYAAAL